MSRSAIIAGTGSYVPEKVLDNQYFDKLLGENVSEWLAGMNYFERHVCAENESAADLAVEAGNRALESAGVDPLKVDLIIVATDTPEYISPATAAVVQHRLGAVNSGNYDLNCACAAFCTAADLGARYIITDPVYNNILVIGVYAMSKYVNWKDKFTCTIFADGAGAVLLQASETRQGFLGGKLIADGSYHDYMGIYMGGTKYPASHEAIDRGEHYLRFLKKFPPDTNSSRWPNLVRDVTKKCGLQVQDVDFILFTQININTIKEVMEELKLPISRTHWIMHKFGYTGSACVPIALDDAVKEGKIHDGDLVCLVGSGGGFSMATVLFRWAY